MEKPPVWKIPFLWPVYPLSSLLALKEGQHWYPALFHSSAPEKDLCSPCYVPVSATSTPSQPAQTEGGAACDSPDSHDPSWLPTLDHTTQRAESNKFSLQATGSPNAQGTSSWHMCHFFKLRNLNHLPPFWEIPSTLTGLLDSVMLTHLHMWDFCQQLFQVLFKTEEREDLGSCLELGSGNKWAFHPSPIDTYEVFPLTQPNWNFNTDEGKESLQIYC